MVALERDEGGRKAAPSPGGLSKSRDMHQGGCGELCKMQMDLEHCSEGTVDRTR